MDQKFNIGQKVKIVPISGSDAQVDMMLGTLVGKTGTITKSYCISRDEMPDRTKLFLYPDVAFTYDVRFEDGNITRGIPEPALAPLRKQRK
jgi:hypothetical protein